MNRVPLFEFHRAAFVHGFADHVEDSAHHRVAHGHGNGSARVEHLITALQSFGRTHGDGPNPVLAEMLLDFKGLLGALALNVELNGQGIEDAWELIGKLNVHYRADYLNDFAFVHKKFTIRATWRRWQFPAAL